ncbi:MAG: response regulator transcription factor [Chloroflexi bacterium]|nr:response regulator transcription factor [Chloroflexota bacterium]
MDDIAVLLASDSPSLRGMIQRILVLSPGMRMAAGIPHSILTPQIVSEFHPAVVVVDIEGVPDDTFDRIEALQQMARPPALIVLGDAGNLPAVLRLLRMGVSGFVQTEDVSGSLAHAIACVAQGQAFLCPNASSTLLDEIRRQPRRRARPTH